MTSMQTLITLKPKVIATLDLGGSQHLVLSTLAGVGTLDYHLRGTHTMVLAVIGSDEGLEGLEKVAQFQEKLELIIGLLHMKRLD